MNTSPFTDRSVRPWRWAAAAWALFAAPAAVAGFDGSSAVLKVYVTG